MEQTIFLQSMRARGFTLLELLVSVGVIAILLGILIPTLREVRLIAKERTVLAHQRQVHSELQRYTTDRRGWYPYYGIPGTALAPIEYTPRLDNPQGIGGFDPDGTYWGQPLAWWWKLILDGYDGALARNGPEVDPEWDIPARPYDAAAKDFMMFGAFATPWFFEHGRTPDVRNHQPMPESAVAFPGAKGLLIRWNTVRRGEFNKLKHFVHFVDGHGEQRSFDTMIRGVDLPSVIWEAPVLTTEKGVLGRDI